MGQQVDNNSESRGTFQRQNPCGALEQIQAPWRAVHGIFLILLDGGKETQDDCMEKLRKRCNLSENTLTCIVLNSSRCCIIRRNRNHVVEENRLLSCQGACVWNGRQRDWEYVEAYKSQCWDESLLMERVSCRRSRIEKRLP